MSTSVGDFIMKRFIAITLMLLAVMGLCACNNGTQGSESSLSGTWYGPDNTPILDIYEDGTGIVDINTQISQAKFSFENGVFTVTSEAYSLTGSYTLSGDTLTVEGETETIVFTKIPAGMITTT